MSETGDDPLKRKLQGKRIMYISWAQSCSRSDHTARELGGISHLVYLPFFGSHPLTILPKYLGQFFISAWLLIRHRPDAVIVMSPPIVAVFAAVIYHFVFRRPFAMDCHTAAFMHPRWKRWQWLQHALGRRAAVNLVHNEYLRDLVEENHGKAVLVKDVPVLYEHDETYDLSELFNVTVVCSFNSDEPIEAILDAARTLPNIQFYLTGNPKFLARELVQSLPKNVTLTGFISDSAFGDLLSRSDVVMSLTTRDHTMLRGAWEAIYQGTPVIVSDWQILRESFPEGAVFVNNSASSIVKAIKECIAGMSQLRAGAKSERDRRITVWQATRNELVDAIFP